MLTDSCGAVREIVESLVRCVRLALMLKLHGLSGKRCV